MNPYRFDLRTIQIGEVATNTDPAVLLQLGCQPGTVKVGVYRRATLGPLASGITVEEFAADGHVTRLMHQRDGSDAVRLILEHPATTSNRLADTPAAPACPRDTDGDGDCGQRSCPDCRDRS